MNFRRSIKKDLLYSSDIVNTPVLVTDLCWACWRCRPVRHRCLLYTQTRWSLPYSRSKIHTVQSVLFKMSSEGNGCLSCAMQERFYNELVQKRAASPKNSVHRVLPMSVTGSWLMKNQTLK